MSKLHVIHILYREEEEKYKTQNCGQRLSCVCVCVVKFSTKIKRIWNVNVNEWIMKYGYLIK